MEDEFSESYQARILAAAESSPASSFALNRANEDVGKRERLKKHCLPLEQRIHAYDEVLRLRRKGLSSGEIQAALQISRDIRIPLGTVIDWVIGRHQPLGNVTKFNLEPSPALAYVIAAKLSDGSIYCDKRKSNYEYRLGAQDYEFVAQVGLCLTELTGQKKQFEPRWDKWHDYWLIRCRGVLLYELLKRTLDELKPYIEHCNDCVAAFLRGFFDGEGSITGRKLTVHNTNKELLSYVQQLLQCYFGIQTTGPHKGSTRKGNYFRSPRNGKIYQASKKCYYLYVRVQNLRSFYQSIGFVIERKKHKLAQAITTV